MTMQGEKVKMIPPQAPSPCPNIQSSLGHHPTGCGPEILTQRTLIKNAWSTTKYSILINRQASKLERGATLEKSQVKMTYFSLNRNRDDIRVTHSHGFETVHNVNIYSI